MIAHKCSPYCEPEEGIHCIPDTWLPDMTVDDFRQYYRSDVMRSMEILKVRQEEDVTIEMQKQIITDSRADWASVGATWGCNYVGYLVWLRDKEQPNGNG